MRQKIKVVYLLMLKRLPRSETFDLEDFFLGGL